LKSPVSTSDLCRCIHHNHHDGQPDITYRRRDPGNSTVDAIVPGVTAAAETASVDTSRIGLVGHSWGGYQTTFTVTQTDLFAAAMAGAPLTNMVSMYNSVYWRGGGTDDGAVEFNQGVEFYNAARRAGKQPAFLVYDGETHGISRKEKNTVGYRNRVPEWFGHYLEGDKPKNDEGPEWIRDGVLYLEQVKQQEEAASARR
jgi:dipeptidyl aminopeptidase/acylaminoacyl peptidase